MNFDLYQDHLLKKFRDELREGICNFFVVEIEGGSISTFKRLYHAAAMFGGLSGYLIEMLQQKEICVEYSKYQRKPNEIGQIIDEIIREPPSTNIILIDPTSIYQKNHKLDLMARLMNKSVTSRDYSASGHTISPFETIPIAANPSDSAPTESVSDIALQLTELLKDPEIIQLATNPLLNLTREQNLLLTKMLESNFESCPTFQPEKVIDYHHHHQESAAENIFDVLIRRVIDYSHFSSPKLKSIVSDVDDVAIAMQNRAPETREKVLAYLKTADRPQETVSNPNYSRRWPVSSKILKHNRAFTKKMRKFGKEMFKRNSASRHSNEESLQMEIDGNDFSVLSEPIDLTTSVTVSELNTVFDVLRQMGEKEKFLSIEGSQRFESCLDGFEKILFLSSNCPRLTMIALKETIGNENVYIDLNNVKMNLLDSIRNAFHLNANVFIQCDEKIASELIQFVARSTITAKVIFISSARERNEFFQGETFYSEIEHKLSDFSVEAKLSYLAHTISFQGVEVALKDLLQDFEHEIPLFCGFFENQLTNIGKIVELKDAETLIEPKFLLLEPNENSANAYSMQYILSQSFTQKIVVLSDDAGMGKTTAFKLLAKLFKDRCPLQWVAFIDLKQSDFTFPSDANTLINLSTREDMFSFITTRLLSLNSLESIVFRHLFKKNRVVFLLDGFDEVSPTYRKLIWKLAKGVISMSRNKVFVSSRPERLKINHKCVGFKLKPFGEQETLKLQEKFTNDGWKLSPLLLKMISQVSFDSLNADFGFNDIFGVYEKFVDQMIGGILAVSNEKNVTSPASLKGFCQNVALLVKLHQNPTITLDDLKLINLCFKNVSAPSVDEVIRSGLIHSDESGQLFFVHQTFADYFVVDFFLKRLTSEKSLSDICQAEIDAINEVLVLMLSFDYNTLQKFLVPKQLRMILMTQSLNGSTALMIAAKRNNETELVNLLNLMQEIFSEEEFRASLRMIDNEQKSALDYSAMSRNDKNLEIMSYVYEEHLSQEISET